MKLLDHLKPYDPTALGADKFNIVAYCKTCCFYRAGRRLDMPVSKQRLYYHQRNGHKLLGKEEDFAGKHVSVKSETFVLRDGAAGEEWKVLFRGRVCSPSFNSRGAAEAYLSLLKSGKRKPEH